jgi:hypothetical protein
MGSVAEMRPNSGGDRPNDHSSARNDVALDGSLDARVRTKDEFAGSPKTASNGALDARVPNNRHQALEEALARNQGNRGCIRRFMT